MSFVQKGICNGCHAIYRCIHSWGSPHLGWFESEYKQAALFRLVGSFWIWKLHQYYFHGVHGKERKVLANSYLHDLSKALQASIVEQICVPSATGQFTEIAHHGFAAFRDKFLESFSTVSEFADNLQHSSNLTVWFWRSWTETRYDSFQTIVLQIIDAFLTLDSGIFTWITLDFVWINNAREA